MAQTTATICSANIHLSQANFHSFMNNEGKRADVVCLQEVTAFAATRLSFTGFEKILPFKIDDKKSTCLVLLKKEWVKKFTFLQVDTETQDLICIKFQAKTLGWKFEIVNAYNRPTNDNPSLYPYIQLKRLTNTKTLLIGDFNCHDPLRDPFRAYRSREAK